MAQFKPSNAEGFFLPTTDLYDSQFVENVDINSPEFRDYLVWLQQSINTHALYINNKTNGIYETEELTSGGMFFSTNKGQSSTIYRQEYRTVVDFGALPDTGIQGVGHNIVGIDNTFTFTAIYGAASDPVALNYIPLSNPDIEIDVTINDVIIETTADLSNYTRCFVILEYIKSL